MPHPSPQKPKEPEWLTRVKNYYWIHDVLHIYVGLFTWVLQWKDGNRLDWLELTPEDSSKIRPVHFEKLFKREAERDAYYFKSLQKLVKNRDVLVEPHRGFYDLFLPLQMEGREKAALYAGSFLKEPASWETLSAQWKSLSGREPAGTDSEFIRYARMAVQLPVLDAELLKAVVEFYRLYIFHLIDRKGKPPLHEKVDQLRRKVFSARLPNSSWVGEALGMEKLIPTPWAWYANQELAPWMKEELGISRIPTQVIAVMPLNAGRDGGDPVRTLLQNDSIQRECFLFAKTLTQTVAGKLQDYGTLFLTSPDPSKNEVQAILQIRERAEKIQGFIRKRFGVKSAAGIGRPVPAGQALYESYREAVLALHLCVQAEKPILLYGETSQAGKGSGYGRLHKAGGDLLGAVEKISTESAKLAGDRYVREVLEFAGRDTGVVRSQFLALLYQFLDRVGAGSALNQTDTENFSAGFTQKLMDADSIYRLIEVFKETIQTMSGLSAKPLEGAKSLRMKTVLNYLDDHFNQTLRLPKVARQAGFSVPVFCRVFKKTTGLSFVSYLNRLRVEKAKNLLRTSGLTALQVGQSCGFQTPHHFIRNFKHLSGMTPGEFRGKMSGD